MQITRDLRDLLIALVLTSLVLGGVAFGAVLLGQHTAGRVVITLTPVAIGENAGREELFFTVDSNSSNPVYCGYDSATVSQTPGATSGARYAPGTGRNICKYPDQEFFCISAGAVLSYDEAHVRTATATATHTVTPTP